MGRRYLVFLCAQAGLYSAFLTLDLLQVGSGWSTALKYGSIRSSSLKRVPRQAEPIATRFAGEVENLNRAAPTVN